MKDIEIVGQLLSGCHLDLKELRRAEDILTQLEAEIESRRCLQSVSVSNWKDTWKDLGRTWEERVGELEAEGYTRSDAQGAVDVEILEGWRPSDFQPWMLLPQITTDPHSTT